MKWAFELGGASAAGVARLDHTVRAQSIQNRREHTRDRFIAWPDLSIGGQTLICHNQISLKHRRMCVAVMRCAHRAQILLQYAFDLSPAIDNIPANATRQAQIVWRVDID